MTNDSINPGALVLVCGEHEPHMGPIFEALGASGFILSLTSPDQLEKVLQRPGNQFGLGVLPDIVILDASENTEKNLALCNILRKQMSGMTMPIMVVAGKDDFDVIDEALNVGASDYVMLPLEIDSFRNRLNYLLHRTAASRGQILRRRVQSAPKRSEIRGGFPIDEGYDDLTGLPKLSLFQKLAERKLASIDAPGENRAALFLVNLDHFRRLKSVLGYEESSRVIERVVDRLEIATLQFLDGLGGRRRSNEDIVLGRVGLDEFAVLVPEIGSVRNASGLARSMLAAISKQVGLMDPEVYLTARIGVAMAPSDGEDIETLVRNGESVLHRQGHDSRNSYDFYSSSKADSAARRVELETELSQALHKEMLEVFYQPQVDVMTGRVCGMEALVRWNHPQLGPLAPEVFIAVAEDVGLIAEIGEWVLKTACKQCNAFHQAGYSDLRIAINISPYQLRHVNMCDLVSRSLSEAGLDPKFLTLEITESLAISDVEETLETIRLLSLMGVKLALDDFGTGYSSLSYIHSLAVDYLKIDRSFVKELPTHAGGLVVAQAITRMAKALNLGVIAEGVESLEQLNCLRKMGCDVYQGFYFSEALPAAQIDLMLGREWNATAL